jgi:hypothetical protein
LTKKILPRLLNHQITIERCNKLWYNGVFRQIMTQLNFIYFVNFDDFLVCHNLGLTNQIASSSIFNSEPLKEEHPIYTVDLEKLLSDVNSIQTFVTPRLKNILLACWHKQGLKIGVGEINTRYYSVEKLNKIFRIAELEIEFERIRRQINVDLPSRLMCIFLAEDNTDGRIMLQNMFFSRRNFCIVSVNISQGFRFHKADSRWIDIYEKTGDGKAIENYWNGIKAGGEPQFEYLLDGQISLENLIDKKIILNDYILRHVPKMKKGH